LVRLENFDTVSDIVSHGNSQKSGKDKTVCVAHDFKRS